MMLGSEANILRVLIKRRRRSRGGLVLMPITMSHSANASWIPPDLSLIHFNNCTYPSTWLAEFTKTIYPNGGQYPMQDTYTILSEGYQQYWDAHNITHPEPGELIGWFFTKTVLEEDTGVLEAVWYHVTDKCLDQFCGAMPWEGNADQAGRGMLASYSVEAACVTVFVLVLFLGRYGRPLSNNALRKQCQRIHEATQETLRSFLDAALLFCIAMLIATIYQFGTTISESSKSVTQSSVIMAAAASIFSIFPAIALHSSAADHLRRGRYRAIIWCAIGLLAVVTISLAMWSLYTIYERTLSDTAGALLKDEGGQLIYEQLCLNLPALQSFGISLIATWSILALAVLVYIILLVLWRIPSLKKNDFLTKLSNKWRSATAILAMMAMWATFGVFVYYRKQLDDRKSETNLDNQWTFGQILALSTFAPVVIEFGFIWWKGAENALTGLMSDRYHVSVTNDGYSPSSPGEDLPTMRVTTKNEIQI